jgi:diguanylate cyclase (GGDEF)-like protein
VRFGQLPAPARAYVLSVYALAATVVAAQCWLAQTWFGQGGAAALADPPSDGLWLFVMLVLAATVAHSFPVSVPGSQVYHVSRPFFVMAMILLSPLQVAVLLVVVHLGEWVWMRRRRSWFAQVFNAAALILATAASQAVYRWLWTGQGEAAITVREPLSILAALVAIATLTLLNHGLVSLAIWLGNGVSPRQQQIFAADRLLVETILLVMGLPFAALATGAAWVVVLGAAPLLLIHRALDLPNVHARTRQDSLTEVATTTTLADTCQRELHRARELGRWVSLLLVDIDRLGQLNAQYGVHAADGVIQATARLLQQRGRGYDLVARVGGGQFAVLLPEAGVAEAEALAERLRGAVAERCFEVASSVDQIRITVSVGLITTYGGAVSHDQLIAAAEAALAQAKRRGGDAVASSGLTLPATASMHQPAASPASAVAIALPQPVALSPVEPESPALAGIRPRVVPSNANPGVRSALLARASILITLATALVAAGLLAVAAPGWTSLDPMALLLLLTFVGLAETRNLELFDRSTHSISVVAIVAAGVLLGVPGAVIVGPVSLLIRGLLRRSRWYKVVFNVSTQVIAGAIAAWIYHAFPIALEPGSALALLLPTALAGGAYYLQNTGLLALAVASELRVAPWRVWLENFRWLWPHYLVLSGMGLLLALAYHAFGILGAIAFVVPPVMMQVVAKQYLDRTLNNVRQLKALNERLEHQAYHDPLTRLANRTRFVDRLEKALARHSEGSLALLFLDLDNFKLINDSLGHQVGDALLLAVTERLKACARAEDTIARLGGDEFTILLENIPDVHDAVRMAERIAARLEAPFTLAGQEMFVGVSVGITIASGDEQGPDDLLRQADVAMYRAKANGKGRYELFDRSMGSRAIERLELETDLRRAVERGEFLLHYQPIINLDTGEVCEVEALVRWQHPRRGLVPPGVFIPLAEETGLIVPLGQWVLEEAARQARRWQTEFPSTRLTMSVNLSGRQLQRPSVVQDVARVLQGTGLPPASLKLEITESVAMQDAESTIETLRRLKEVGVQLAIDDFGTGFSSLAYLNRFPIDALKVDRSFVARLGDSPEDRAVVRTIVALAKALDLVVTAEGIETIEQAEQLRTQGCDLGQGFYFAKPQASDKIARLLGTSTDATRLLLRAA